LELKKVYQNHLTMSRKKSIPLPYSSARTSLFFDPGKEYSLGVVPGAVEEMVGMLKAFMGRL